jgi:hypothetical protein
VGRWARDADDPDNEAVVYVRTDAIPDRLVDEKVSGFEGFGQKQKAAVDHLRANPGATCREAKEAIEGKCGDGVTKRTVSEIYKKLVDAGYAERKEGAGAYGADEYELVKSVPAEGLVRLT